MSFIRIRVSKDVAEDRHLFMQRWWTREWITTPLKHYPDNALQELLKHSLLDIETSDDGKKWTPFKRPKPPKPKPAPHPSTGYVQVDQVALERERDKKKREEKERGPRIVLECEKCGQLLGAKDREAGRTRHRKCPAQRQPREVM